MAYPVQTDPTAVFGRRVRIAALLDAVLIFVPVIMLATSSVEYLEVSSLQVDGQQFCDTYLTERGGFCLNAEDIDGRVYFSDESDLTSTSLYWGLNFLLLVMLQAFTGWTPGKLVIGIRVVGEDGGRPGL